MSDDYKTEKKIRIADVVDGRLEKFGIRENIEQQEIGDDRKCLTDGQNYLWVYASKGGLVRVMTRYGENSAKKILEGIAEAFDTRIFTEDDFQFYGFETEEEWHMAFQCADKMQEEFYSELLRFVSGEPHRFKPGTIGEIEAKIAKLLVEVDSTLIQPHRREELLRKVNQLYYAIT